MRIINLLSFGLILCSLMPCALASPKTEYLFQAKAQNIATQNTPFWNSFWEILSGKNSAKEIDLTVKVTNASTGAALKNATVLVGPQKGIPFAENLAKTNEEGIATFSDEKLKPGNPQVITAALPGYFGTVTLFGITQNNVEIALQPLPKENIFAFLEGRITGFPSGYDKKTLELGVFMPAIRPDSLLNFNLSDFISSFTVELDLYGKRDVPGNLVFPKQEKRYAGFPVNLDKPEFIMPMMIGTEAHMIGSVGAIDLSTAIKAMKSRDYISMFNNTNLTNVGWTRRFPVTGAESFDIEAIHSLRKDAVTTTVRGVPDNQDLVAVSMFDPEGDKGDFITLDVKSLAADQIKSGAGSLKLSLLNERKRLDRYYVFAGVTKSEDFENITKRTVAGAIVPVTESRLSAKVNGFMQLMDVVSVGSNNRDYRFTSAENSRARLTPNLTILNIVSDKKVSITKGSLRSVLWTAIIPGSVNRITLPDLGRPVLPIPDAGKEERFSWEVIAIKAGLPAAKGTGLDVQSALRNLQHVSALTKSF